MRYAIILCILTFGFVGNVNAGTGFFESLFGEKHTESNGLQEIPEGRPAPEDQTGKYWQVWLEEYKCTFDQLSIVEKDMALCVAGDYKKEYCFANAKRLYCNKYEDEY